jgi:hypothetical protein
MRIKNINMAVLFVQDIALKTSEAQILVPRKKMGQ